jgi:hypothetical protein
LRLLVLHLMHNLQWAFDALYIFKGFQRSSNSTMKT